MFQGAEKCAEFVEAQFPLNLLHFSLGFPSTSFGMEFGTFFGTPKHTFGTKFGTQFGTRVETPLSQKRRQVLRAVHFEKIGKFFQSPNGKIRQVV